jgi:ABC-type phosphate transport system permease subunit
VSESASPQPVQDGQRHTRRTPLAARGDPAVWLTGGALVACLALISALLLVIVWRGGITFWPRPIDRVEMVSGVAFLGSPAGIEIDASGVARSRFRVGNRDLGQESFRWIDTEEIVRSEPSPDAVIVERAQWGVFIGKPVALLHVVDVELGPGEALPPPAFPEAVRTTHETLRGSEDAGRTVRLTSVLAEGTESVFGAIPDALEQAEQRRARIRLLGDVEIPRIQDSMSRIVWDVRAAELRAWRVATGERSTIPVWTWVLSIVAGAGCVAGIRAISGRRRLAAFARSGLWVGAGIAALVILTEHPWAGRAPTPDQLAAIHAAAEDQTERLESQRSALLAELDGLRQTDAEWRLMVVDPASERFAPISQSRPDEPMLVSQVQRIIRPNGLSGLEKVGVYLGRWVDYLSLPPGEEPGTGGVWPVIVGTVTLTLLLTVSVVPLGVIAALYLREYAKQGIVTSAIRIAINNLAGVPSIVYGMFGLGFFCYMVGGYIDAGPGDAAAPKNTWWLVIGAVGVFALAGSGLWLASRAQLERGRDRLGAGGRWIAVGAWISAVALAAYAVSTTPYFGGFFAEKLPQQPTFGGRGILWASLTLALLTLPVVIVATEEAIAAVPRSMREGSYGCGASRWQTIRNIVLPAALPGIMTGAILAMARGAGEVAPLMLVGAVNLAPTLPVTTEPPFLHGDRTFMHLGFHIYNLGFQSPDAEAAEPMVWTTTLLLVGIVLALNLVAIILRARLRRGSGGSV